MSLTPFFVNLSGKKKNLTSLLLFLQLSVSNFLHLSHLFALTHSCNIFSPDDSTLQHALCI